MPEDKPAAGHWADPFYNARYGMGVNERANYDYSGRGAAAVPGEPANERTAGNSAYLFAQQYPWLAPVVQPILNTVEGNLPSGVPFAATPGEIDARQRGTNAAFEPAVLPDVRLPDIFNPPGGPKVPDTSSVETGDETFRVAPPVPQVPEPFFVPSFMAPTLPAEPPSAFDDGFDEFARDRGSNTSGTAPLDPFAGDDPFGDPLFGSVTPDGSPIEPVGMQPGAGNAETGTAGGNLPEDFNPEDDYDIFADVNQQESQDQTNFLQGGGPGQGSNQDATRRSQRQALADEYGQNAGIFADLFLGGGGSQDKFTPLF